MDVYAGFWRERFDAPEGLAGANGYMIATEDGTCSLIFERQIPHPPAKIWRALTQPALIQEWLMENDFVLEVGHRFTVRAAPLPGWSGVTHCEVVEVEAPRLLIYRWGDGTESDTGLKTLITWTLTPRQGGTLLRFEQSGFRPVDQLAHTRMGAKWRQFLARLERLVGEVA